MIHRDGSVAVCTKIETERKYGDVGWIHEMNGDSQVQYTPPVVEPVPRINADKVQYDCSLAITENKIAVLANELRITPNSLKRMQIGWSVNYHAYTFPMRSGAYRIIGFRVRSLNGAKWSYPGGRNGLFIPRALVNTEPYLLAEGTTDTAALLDLGYSAIGSPDCRGGVKHLLYWLRLARLPAELVVVADPDAPGISGAENLVKEILGDQRARRNVCSIKMIVPPAKDIREWITKSGAGNADIDMLINEAEELKGGE